MIYSVQTTINVQVYIITVYNKTVDCTLIIHKICSALRKMRRIELLHHAGTNRPQSFSNCLT